MVISVYQTGTVDQDAPIQWWILAAGGVGIVIGLATWGYRVMATIGQNLAKVTPSRGFDIELGAAMTVVMGSKLGLPLSTTHCKVLFLLSYYFYFYLFFLTYFIKKFIFKLFLFFKV